MNLAFENIPDPRPFTTDEQFNKAVDCIRAFELKEMNYNIYSCSICNETRIDMKIKNNICDRCTKDKLPIKMFSTENNMDPGVVPPELKDLTIVEQQLISRISPCINLHMLKHGGLAANGHCVAFPQEVSEPGKISPKLPSEVNIKRIRKQGENDTSKEFNVMRYKIQNALIWLKENNSVYSDIIISQDRINLLTVDGELEDISTLEYREETQHLNDQGPAVDQIDHGEIQGETVSGVSLPHPNINIKEIIENAVKEISENINITVSANKKGQVCIPWPTRKNEVMSEFTTRQYFSLAFPCLFPCGNGDFHLNRARTCTSLSDWANHLIWFKDGRFANHNYKYHYAKKSIRTKYFYCSTKVRGFTFDTFRFKGKVTNRRSIYS
jgi:hypothetical protein